MRKRQLPLSVFLLLCALSMTQSAYYFPQLPETVAIHFGLSGRPDSWSSKTTMIAFSYGLTVFMLILFLGISCGMSRIPESLVNLPNKRYWLSEERRRETFEWLSHHLLWFGSATVLFLLDLHHQIFQVNLGRAHFLSHVFLGLGLYIICVVISSITLFRKFKRVPSSVPK